ncbi:MAG: hypothetical protein FWD92_01660 [Methanomassiliicoccaceae archaeon]|nr:hypothetical protein [Methanomassiliicoccaceae archaeon]
MRRKANASETYQNKLSVTVRIPSSPLLLYLEEDRAGEDYDSDMDPDEAERITREEYERVMELKEKGRKR